MNINQDVINSINNVLNSTTFKNNCHRTDVDPTDHQDGTGDVDWQYVRDVLENTRQNIITDE